jgi:sugar phosphate isomerase/epimerase
MKSIIELAKQAGFERVIDVNPHTGIRTVEAYAPDSLERLANLVRAEVLEEAAVYFENHWSYEWTDDQVVAAIRALKTGEAK